MSRGHIIYQILTFRRTHEEEQGISSMLELMNLVNLDGKAKPSGYLTYCIDYGDLNRCVVDLAISYLKPPNVSLWYILLV